MVFQLTYVYYIKAFKVLCRTSNSQGLCHMACSWLSIEMGGGGGTPKELHWDPFQCTQDTQATKQSPFTKVFRGQPWGVNKLEGKLWNHTANLILGFSTASAVTCRPSCPLLTLVATIEPAVHINNPSKALLWRQPSVNAC